MRVLVACEYSGVVREAFRARGHEAWSCDLLPSDDNSIHHLQEDVLQVLARAAQCGWKDQWDLMIAHPPCTYLCNSGVCWLLKRKYTKTSSGADKVNAPRWRKMEQATEFFNALLNCGIPKIAIENPIPHRYGVGKTYTQIIQPFQFGHPERKATCLWLKGLPKLKPTNIVPLPMDKSKAQRLHWLPPSKDRWKIRSRTFEGIAKAMAEQWG